MGLTTFHNLVVNATGIWTLGQANWQIRFPSLICLNDAYLGRISTDSPSSLIFHNCNTKWIVIPHFYVNDSQLGSDIHYSKLRWNLVILEVWCLLFEALIVKSVISSISTIYVLIQLIQLEFNWISWSPNVRLLTDYFAWAIFEDSGATCL